MYIYYIYFVDSKNYQILEIEDKLTIEEIKSLFEYITERIEVYDFIENPIPCGLVYKNY